MLPTSCAGCQALASGLLEANQRLSARLGFTTTTVDHFRHHAPPKLGAFRIQTYPRLFDRSFLVERVAQAGSFAPEQFAQSESRDIVLRPGTPKEKKLSASAYLLHYGLPQFFFHVTTAYALLRHNGVEVGKRDYMGSY